MRARPSFLPASHGSQVLPHHPGTLAEIAAENVKGTACLGRWENSGPEPQARLSEPKLLQPQPAVLLPGYYSTGLGQPVGRRQEGARPTPWGNSLVLLFSEQGKRSRRVAGWGRAHLPQSAVKGTGVYGTEQSGLQRQGHTCVPLGPLQAKIHTGESSWPSAHGFVPASPQHSLAQSNNDGVQ